MTPLRKRMITDMQLRRFSKHTQRAYLSLVIGLAEYYKKSPDKISPDEFRDYVLFLTNERRLSYNSINTITAGIRFFYSEILDRKEMSLAIPRRKRPKNLPEIFSRDELVLLFSSIENKKHRTLLVTTYSCGLRVSEVIRLKIADIDSKRMTVKVS